MAFTVVLDTCALYPAHLRDTLLRLAERGLYRAVWSVDIVKGLTDNLIQADIPHSAVEHLATEMSTAFPEAEISGYQPLIDSMTCDPKDRHVLAVAVRAHADAIVTFNESDFPADSVAQYEIEIIHPSTFLLDLLGLNPQSVISELEQQASANRSEPKTLLALLRALDTAGARKFANGVRSKTLHIPDHLRS